jgi:signal transduction histidine kinase
LAIELRNNLKLSNKLILFIAGSKLALVALFVVLLPVLVKQIAFDYTNFSLRGQQKKVLQNIDRKGVEYYLEGETSYGSYTMLKDEYIALEHAPISLSLDTIKTTRRIVETDTLNYRVLSYTFKKTGKNYLLEIGKTTASINLYNDSLQRFALYVLVILIVLSIVTDLIFTRSLIRPLGQIISTRLGNTRFPFKITHKKIKTSTSDFKFLDQSLISLMGQINDAFAKEREFTANASHEFMTPISILQNKMENLLTEESASGVVQEAIVDMMRTLERLKKISRSLLLISRIENEQFLKQEKVEPKKILEEIIEEIGHRLEEKKISINVVLKHNLILTDSNHDLLFQLLHNLIHNAIKFNKPNGTIMITDYLSGNNYSISITDDGIGIEQENIEDIFDRFKKSGESENSGYGLGLAIVKSIATYLNIKIVVKSKKTQGTTFQLLFARFLK